MTASPLFPALYRSNAYPQESHLYSYIGIFTLLFHKIRFFVTYPIAFFHANTILLMHQRRSRCGVERLFMVGKGSQQDQDRVERCRNFLK